MSENARFAFEVDAVEDGEGTRFAIRAAGRDETKTYRVPGGEQADYAGFFRRLAGDWGTRIPHAFAEPAEAPEGDVEWRPLLTDNISPRILAATATRPCSGRTRVIFSSPPRTTPRRFPDPALERPRTLGACRLVFPEGHAPAWTASGRRVGDFWRPKWRESATNIGSSTPPARPRTPSHRPGKSASPLGPWRDLGNPSSPAMRSTRPAPRTIRRARFSGGVIDSHILVDEDGQPFLFWKADTNGVWPRPLAALLRERPELIERLFVGEEDRRTAAFAAAIVPWANGRRPMERFFLMQPLIEAALANWRPVRQALDRCGVAGAIVEAMRTPIYAQRIAGDGASFLGEPAVVLANDLDWEGHLIEGPWVTRQKGRYWLFYAGNDFSTPAYGIGVAVADHPLGPYVKQPEPLLRSTRTWTAPGHASVAPGLDGEPQLFFHAFHPGTGGYNVFRALLTVRLEFGADGVAILPT